jgi:hypothetical protein
MRAEGRQHTPKTITVVVVDVLSEFSGTRMEPTVVRRNCQHFPPLTDLSKSFKYKSPKLFGSELRVRAADIQVEAHNLIRKRGLLNNGWTKDYGASRRKSRRGTTQYKVDVKTLHEATNAIEH